MYKALKVCGLNIKRLWTKHLKFVYKTLKVCGQNIKRSVRKKVKEGIDLRRKIFDGDWY